ncbi:MAG TPA: metabolite traffic protein EboE, partial [Rhodothermales bacterium]|nr:metabolite traffic protein EboE [Rhodothermales bacterium]
GRAVKDKVYEPDWRSAERVDYTLRLARILADLLPEDVDGGISTSPISYKPWLNAQERREALEHGAIHLALLTAALAQLRDQTDRLIHVDIEPEPNCLLENMQETVGFFCNWLLPRGGNVMIVDDLLDHIRVCYDTCHFAVEYENPSQVFWKLAENGIRIGKIQISSALRVPLPQDLQRREHLSELIQPFAESTYLHQVVERTVDGTLQHYLDLPDALPNIMDRNAEEWRIHYHVPVFAESFGGLDSTQADTADALDVAKAMRCCPHLEIETYTWEVLPPELNLSLADSLQREYEWVLAQFAVPVAAQEVE